MRKAVVCFALAMLLAVPVFAQNSYKAEIFGGYQYTRVNPGSGISGQNFNGWNASLTGNANQWLGFTADFSGGYKDINGVSAKVHNFLFGPTISSNKSEHFKPFAHALFGISHASAAFAGSGASDNSFGMALGGGVDAGITKNIAVRLIQADYLMTRFSSETQNNARISAGIVFRF
ncbi:MAG: outer membrane beta-barrel protein [Terriglobales bacterium]